LPAARPLAAEKILEPGEDWRLLGTDEDPVVQEAFGIGLLPDAADLEVAD